MRYLKMVFMVLLVFTLSSCGKDIEENVEFNYVIVEENHKNNKINFTLEMTNPNDLNMINITIILDAYFEDTYLGEIVIETNAQIKHLRTQLMSAEYVATEYNAIDRVELKTYHYDLDNFFNTHFDDFVIAAIFAAIILIPLLIYFVIDDYMISDFTNLIVGNYYFIPIPFVLVIIVQLLLNISLMYRLGHISEWMFVIYSFGFFLIIIPIAYLFLYIMDKIKNIRAINTKFLSWKLKRKNKKQ